MENLPEDAQFEDLYKYRCTTDKLLMHVKRIENAGDTVLWPAFVGGRDWLLICRKAQF
jgi:hypothetical protein